MNARFQTFRRIAALALAFVCTSAGAEQLQIRSITIQALDVFSGDEAAHGWIYSLTNAVHVQTRESVIRKFLLFSEGDVFDARRIAETERNLRNLGFIKSASIAVSRPDRGFVDVTVTTQDSWTTEPGVSFGSKGGTSSFGFELQESNLLGTGRKMELLYENTGERTRSGIEYHDPAFFRPYWTADALVSENSDGSEQRLAIGKPFYSLDVDRAGLIEISRVARTDRIYRSGAIEHSFAEQAQRLTAEYGFALHRSGSTAARLTAGIDFIDHAFAPAGTDPAAPPEDRRHRYVFARYERVEDRFIELQWVNRDQREEDFNLGTRLAAQLGISPRALGGDADEGLARLELSRGFPLGRGSFLLADVSWDSRLGGERSNSMLLADAFAVRRFATRMPQTLVGRIHLAQGRELDRDRQLFADAGSGLRGYRLHAFEGDKVLIVNAEHRIFLGREILQLISPGIAVFVDAGTAAREGEPLRLDDLKLNAGLGFRLGLTRSPNNSLRIDLAWPFDPDPLGRTGPVLSISMSRPF